MSPPSGRRRKIMSNNNQLKVVPNMPIVNVTDKPTAHSVQAGSQRKPVHQDQMAELPGEMLAYFKDSRLNTKKVIAASCESTKRVQDQNQKVIDMCERELKRKDLSEDQRTALLDQASQAAASSTASDNDHRAFVNEEQRRSERNRWWLLSFVAVILFGSAAIRHAA